jgi:hypothetical protein
MFLEPDHSVLEAAPPAHALLSQNFRQHPENLLAVDGPVLDQTDHNPYMLHHRLRPWSAPGWGRRVTSLWRRGRHWASARGPAALIERLFALPPLVGAVVGHTPPDRLLSAMGLPAAKGAAQIAAPDPTQIRTAGIARIGEKEDAAVPTAGQAPSQVRPAAQHRSHELVVLQDQQPDFRPAIPVPRKLKVLRDLDCKKPKVSLRTLTLD